MHLAVFLGEITIQATAGAAPVPLANRVVLRGRSKDCSVPHTHTTEEVYAPARGRVHKRHSVIQFL